MKTAKIQKLIKGHLLPALKPFGYTGRMMFSEPIGSVLRGVYFEDSGFSPTVLYGWAFVQPLYVPSEHVHFTFGHRLMNRADHGRACESWNIDDEPDEHQIQSLLNAIRTDAISFIQKLEAPQDLARRLAESSGLHDNVFVKEAVAYSLAKIGDYASAKQALERIVHSVRPDDPWYGIKARSEELLRRISESPNAASELLERWEQETAHNLRLRSAGGQ